MIKFKKCLFYFNIITFFIVIGLSAFLLMNLEDFKQSLVIAQSEDQHDEIEYADIYIDSRAPEGGNGSLEAPYNNLSIINDLTITPGTIIRLRAGSIFETPFIIENIEGDENNSVIIGKYGSGRRPIIAANDYTGGGILYIKNCQNIIVESLELFDTATLEGDRRGILIEIGGGTEENILYYNNITVQDMYVHDIRGITDAENSGMSNASKKTGGIMAWTKDKFTAYNNLIINNNIVRNVDNCGIAIWKVPTTSPQGTVYDADFDFIAHKNVYITNNEISDIGKNAIVVRYLLGGHISGNTVYKTAVRCISGNQIFTRDCKGTIIERNEGFMNMARPDKAGVVRDGSMLDPDLRSPDTIWQYNYSHDNAFGLMTNCTDVRDNIVVRYNISVADKSYLLNINYDVNSMHIYNNTFYIPQNYNSIIIHERKQKLSQRDENQNYIFENNLIYNDSLSASFDFAVLGESGTHNDIVNTITRSFSNNLLYSAKSEEQGFTLPKAELFEYANGKDGELQSGYLKANPMIVKAYGGTSVERIGWGILNNFKLLKQSPALGAGKPISDGLTHCFFGNIITSPPNIGAYGGMGEEQDLEQEAYLNPDDYSTPRFDNVEKISDIVYAESVTNYDGTKRNLKLDIYRPKNDMQRNRPLVVMVHGGGFRIGSTKEQNYIVNLSNLFARHGYVVAAIEYRLRKGSDMPDRLAEVPAMIDAAEDANRALEWLRTKGGVYGYNPDYMFVAGGSAGGRTAVAYAYSSQEKGYDKSGVVAIGNLWGSPEIEFRSEYDVSNQFEGRFIPMIIIHGTNDNTIPYDNAIYMKNSLLNAGYNEGVDFAFQAIQGGGHPPTNVSNGTQIIFDYVNTFFIARLKNYIQNVTNGVTPPPPPESDPEQEDYIGPTSSDKVIYSSRDTYISEDDVEQNINFAHQDKLRVYGGKWSKQKSAILRFDIPKNDIYSVKLQITVIAVEEVSVSKPQIIDVSIISNHYLIDEITWNTFNHSQQKIKIGNIIVTGAGTYTLELKDYVADQIKQTAITLSLLLEDTQINSIAKTEIGSYENPNNEPRLNLIKRGDSAEPGLMFEPTDDTYLLSSASNGFSDVIRAKSSGTNHVIRGFIRFDLATLQEEIDTAYLYLYFIGKETPNTEGFSLRVSNFNDWDESSLSWQSTPHPNNYIINDLTQIIPVSNEGVWIKIDIKHILTNPNFVDKLYTFGIYPSKSDAGVIFASKESQNSPYIAINQVEGETPQYRVSIDIVNGKGGDVFISNTTVFKNENLTVLIKPEYDYFIEYVKINGQKIDFSDYLIVISDINNDISIEVQFNKQNLLMASFSTYTREDMPNTAYDKNEFFAVKTTLTGTNSRIGYLCFKNLNEDVLSNKVIFRIMGYKAVELGSKAMPIGVYAFSDGAKWLENGITWNNQPINDLFYKGKVQDVAGVSASAGLKSGTKLGVLNAISLTWYELDITEYVHALVIAGIHDFGITLVDECNDGAPRFEFYSTMTAQEYRPHLRLDPADKFELETVKITVDTGDYGTVFGQGEVIIGYDYEIFIICDAGYKISQAIVNGQVVNVIRNKILLKNVKEGINIIILFEKIVL